MPQGSETPAAKSRHSCDSSGSRPSTASRTSKGSLGKKTRNIMHHIRDRFSTDLLNTEHDGGTVSLPVSPAKHRWWKSMKSKSVTSPTSVMTIPWVGPAASTVRYGESPQKASELRRYTEYSAIHASKTDVVVAADSFGKAYRRKSLPDKLPLLFATDSPDGGDPDHAGGSAPSRLDSICRKKAGLGSPPRLEIPSSTELDSPKLSSFREISEQAIQGVSESRKSEEQTNKVVAIGSKYDKGMKSPKGIRGKDTPLDGKAIEKHADLGEAPVIDAVLAASLTTSPPVETASPDTTETEAEDMPAVRKFPIQSQASFSQDSETGAEICAAQKAFAEGITKMLNRQALRIRYPTYGFWQCNGEVIKHRNGKEALASFQRRNKTQSWSNQLLYNESQSTLLVLPTWVIVDRKKLGFKSWTWASLEVFPTEESVVSEPRKSMGHPSSPAFGRDHEREPVNTEYDDVAASKKAYGWRPLGSLPIREKHSYNSRATREESIIKDEKHVSFSEQIQVLNDSDEGGLPGHEDNDKSSIDGGCDDKAYEDWDYRNTSRILEPEEVASEIKNATSNDAEVSREHSISAHDIDMTQANIPSPRLRRSTLSIQRLQVSGLSPRDDELENMSPIELEDMDMDMAKRLGGRTWD